MSGSLALETDKSEITGEYNLVLLKEQPSLDNFFSLINYLRVTCRDGRKKCLGAINLCVKN